MPNIDDLLIPQYNWQPHRDIDIEILKKQNGLFSFVLKIAAGRIVDFMTMETITHQNFNES